MRLALTEEIRNIDRKTVEEAGIPGIVLMESAGRAVFEVAADMLGKQFYGKKVCVFAGKGNNGGDAFVAARYLLNNGAAVKVFLIDQPQEDAADASQALHTLNTMQADIFTFAYEHDWDRVLVHLLSCDLVIDGLLGTGFRGKLEGDFAHAAKLINDSQKPVLAIDIPSGVNADNGLVEEIAVRASHTVTLALPKPGLFLYPGKAYAGDISVAPLGIPNKIIDSMQIKQKLITADMVAYYLPRRSLTAHKNQAKTAVIAGERGTTGAAVLCCEAALRAGSGLVKLFSGQDVADLFSVKLTEVMVDALASDEAGLAPEFAEVLLAKTSDFDVLAVGSGLGAKAGTKETVRQLLLGTDRKLVLDADALNALAEDTELLLKTKEIAVITPHLGEMSRLTGLSVGQIQQEGALRIARKYAVQWQTIVVLKGAPTVVAFPDGEAFVNTVGNPGMATAGSGDVLTGVIAALIAQGLDQAPAAVCGVYLHSLAADLIAQNAMVGMAAGDIVTALPQAIMSLTNPQ